MTRKNRISTMLSFIQSSEQGRASLTEIKYFMLTNFGLKFDATTKYVRECALAGFLAEKNGKWKVTKRHEQ